MRTVVLAGAKCELLAPAVEDRPAGVSFDDWEAQRIARLPKPVAIFCPWDEEARAALAACARAGVSVPKEVAVLGVDNDLDLCSTTWPRLSSVATSARLIGRTALRVLLSMIEGEPPPRRPILIPPTDVVERESTSESVVSDPIVQAAVKYMRTNLAKRMSISDVADAISVSRRTLVRQFVKCLKRTPVDELRRVRLEHARELLIHSDAKMSEVARACGLIHSSRLTTLIKEATGFTPNQFREQFGKKK